MTAYLMVSEASGKHYATLQMDNEPNVGANSGERKIFTVTEKSQSPADLFTKLQQKAKDEARRRGIKHVINLD